jgi:hypothetical protein
VRHRAYIRTIPVRIPQRTSADDPLLVPDHSVRRLVVSPSTPSSFLWLLVRGQNNEDSGSLAGRFTHSLLLQLDSAASNHKVRVSLVASASLNGRLQADVSIERQFSRIFPAHPRSLASVLVPRPITPAHKNRAPGTSILRHGAALLRLRRPAGFGFQKIFSANLHKEHGRKDFPNLPKKRRLALGAGHTRVASRKSVPRVIRANTTKEN